MPMSEPPDTVSSSPDRNVLALPADMIFGAKIRGTAQALGVAINLARNPKDLIEKAGAIPQPSLIILDLDTRGLDIPAAIAALKAAAPDTPLLAYVSHVNTDAIKAARNAGADRVLARSAFTASLSEILRGS